MNDIDVNNDGNLDLVAQEMRVMASDLRYNTTLQLLYTGLLIDRYLNIKASKKGQNRSRFDILHTIVAHGGSVKQSYLAAVMRSKQAVNQVIDGLEHDGLVERSVMEDDHRTKRVDITDKGLDIIRGSLPDTLKTCQSVISMLTEEETTQLKTILKKVRKNLLAEITSSEHS